MRLSYLAQDRLDLAETAKRLGQRMSEPRELDFVQLKHAARYLVGKPKAALRFGTQEHADKTSLRGQLLCLRPSVEEEYDGTGGTDW